MAYFDSLKNRAIWERELSLLRPEREARKQPGYVHASKKDLEAVSTDTPHRRQINMEQLQAAMGEKHGDGKQRATPQAAAQVAHRPTVAKPSIMAGAVRVPRPKASQGGQ